MICHEESKLVRVTCQRIGSMYTHIRALVDANDETGIISVSCTIMDDFNAYLKLLVVRMMSHTRISAGRKELI